MYLIIIEVIAFVFALVFGVLWYLNENDNYEPLLGISLLVGVLIRIYRQYSQYRDRKTNEDLIDRISCFIEDGQTIRRLADKEPLPIDKHNEWVSLVHEYFDDQKQRGYSVRFNDFSGLVFYGNGSEKSKLLNSIEGRITRLAEFVSELQSK